MYKIIFATKNGKNSFNLSLTGSHKRLWIHHVLQLEMAGKIFPLELCILCLILSTKDKKCLCIRFVCLCKLYFSNVWKLIYIIQVYYRIFLLKMIYIELIVVYRNTQKNNDTLRSMDDNYKKMHFTI